MFRIDRTHDTPVTAYDLIEPEGKSCVFEANTAIVNDPAQSNLGSCSLCGWQAQEINIQIRSEGHFGKVQILIDCLSM